MSKSSTATASKIAPQLPQKSAWSRGPPSSTSSAPTPRSQSPAPNATPPASATHSRRPSALGQGVSFKEGVGAARSPTNTVKAGSAVTFGSIDDVSAPISSSPASVPPIKTEGVKSFGTVPATPTSAAPVNGKPHAASSSTSGQASSSSSTPAVSIKPNKSKFDVKKLFQNAPPSSSSSPSTSDMTSPPSRPSPLPHPSAPTQPHAQPQHQHPPQFGQQFSTFVPSGLRPQQNGTSGTGQGPPRSPVVYSRQPPNVAPTGVNVNGRAAPQGPQGGPPLPPAMPSPRMGPPSGQPTAMSPAPWGYYATPYAMDPQYYYAHAHPQWGMMPQQSPGGGPPAHPGMPVSPRNPPPQLHPPGTPTMSPAVPAPGHPPHNTPSPHIHTASLSNITSPPATPSSSSGPGAAGSRSMRTDVPAFVPKRSSGVVIKDVSGHEVGIEKLKENAKRSSIPPSPASPARPAVRLESDEQRRKRLAEEERKKEEEAKAKKEAEEKERKKRAQEEEAERKRKEEEAEKERIRKEEEEKERLRKEEEEKERLRKEEEERERVRKEAEEQERLRKEAEEKEKAEQAAKERAVAESKPEPIPEAEEGEVEEESKEAAKAKSADKALLRIDTAVSSTTPARPRPGPLDLSSAKGAVAAPLPSALATARIIDDLQSVPYPDGILSPKVELNVNAKEGKFRYDREFLLQFMAICKDKPDNLPPLDVLGINPQDQPQFPMTRTSSGRRQPSVGGMGPPAPRTASVGLGIGFGGKPGAGSGFTMGQFSTPANKMTSEERFNVARSTSVSGPPGMPFGRQVPMVRSSSQGGPGGTPMGQRTRSRRGEKRGGDKSSVSQSAFQSMHPSAQPLEPVAPLEASANRWTPASIIKKPQAVDENSPEVVERKVKSLLNKLTMERFDSISDQIIQWANKSEAEKDGRTLIQVIKLVFEKATDEATWSEMYARLCRKMMEQISNKVQDDGIRNAEGKPIAGGQLFRKYLLNRCQEDFERGWIAKEATAAAAATKATEDQAAKAAAHDEKDGEIALYSEEYYAAQKAKRQGLGLVKFIGELFKLQMLTERIMHECIKKLLSNVDNPEEEEIESLCKLMTTVGQLLDTPKARAHMDVYFTRMKELVKSPHVNSRMQFMLQDVIEMRERKWIPRSQAAAPTTIAAVHEAAAKEKAASDKDSYQRTLSMSRGGSRRGGDRDQTVGPDGWVVTGTAVPRAPPKAGDLSNFGKISKTASMSFGPSSVFNKKEGKPGPRDSTISRTGSVNMFSMLSQNPELASETLPSTGKSSRPPSRKASIDLGHAGAPEAPLQRRKLNLLPRSVPKDESKDTPTGSAANSEDEHAESGTPSMSEAEAKKKIDEDSKEFFSIRDLDEAEVYFTKLPVEHRHLLIDKLVTGAIESKEADSQLVADLFHRAFSKNLCSPATFEEGFTPTAEILDDIAIDAPKAFQLFATMLKGAGLDKDEERCTRIASKSTDSDKLLELLS
ncbi:unnamed protein product [Somion occarium]|uniref:MI domain-containing protein n=1 Tax=Somion occarium TaxID=3059160 RepID=A0ABP1DUG4_9APHY